MNTLVQWKWFIKNQKPCSSKTVPQKSSWTKTVFIEYSSSKPLFIKNCSSKKQHVHFFLFINEHVHRKLFINEHFHGKLFINEQEKINVHYHTFLMRPASAGALCRACRLTINIKSRFIFPSCPNTYIIFSPECLCLWNRHMNFLRALTWYEICRAEMTSYRHPPPSNSPKSSD